eukprot:TRINITY_DN25721_c0_g1_i1.p1 TRINITY_DN25721_c0_g1~~TRINITY_DN25721_c0_g1_i1.p1  ORF type:complete len:341 (+),score=30.07 TRINITY_DN25721_c0_g1_i1:251-1273(+)
MAEDPQMMKKIAAAAYDYENDPRWSEYWSNILIPPQMASRPEVVTHYKLKFYQRYIDSELEVGPFPRISSERTTTSTQASPPRQSQTSNTGAHPERTARSTGSFPRPPASHNSLRLDRNSIQFLANASVLVMAILAVIPFFPSVLADRAYRFALLVTWFSCSYSIYSQYGKPRAWNLQAIQLWLQSLVSTKDFVYFLYCFVFFSSPMPIKFALVSVVCRSLEFVAKFLRRNFSSANIYRKYLEDACLWIDANTTSLNILSSNCEIMLGFLLIALLLTRQRNLVQVFMYWQLLKLMYRMPNMSSYHHSAWVKLGSQVNPVVHRHLPFLRSPLSFIQRWFQQ